MSPGARKVALTAHVVASVGWLGAVAAFLGVGVVGLASDDPETTRGVYLVMEPAAWIVLVPLALASLVTGLVQSLGTAWGVFRHYWVVFKLVINVFSTVVLLVYMGTFRHMADVAGDPNADLSVVRNSSPVLHAALALALLTAATILAVHKPRGLTPWGQRVERRRRRALQPRQQDERPADSTQ
jgi:DMSO/TMAO reductase YedYZ heme-binding membrane subunit